jgi:putative flippase GtrA
MNGRLRFVRFNAVGAAGIAVQLSALWLLTGVAHVHYIPATIAAVTLAVVHNFVWHRRWTWGDRDLRGRPMALFARFAAANGAVSLLGNLAAMTALVSVGALTPVVANGVAIALTGALNFWVGDAVVFRGRAIRWSWPPWPEPRPRVRAEAGDDGTPAPSA